MDIAAMMAGAVPAGIYFSASPQDAAYILNHSQCEIVLAEKQEHFEKIAKERAQLNRLRHVVMMKGVPAEDPLQMSWENFLAHGAESYGDEVERRLDATNPSACGTLIYTSGTTGLPKAVELSHGAIDTMANLIPKLWNVSGDDRVISYLPLAHIAEQITTIHCQAVAGNSVYFARSMLELGQHLAEVQPDIFFGVPRVFEKIVAGMQLQLANVKGVKGKLARWAMKTGEEWHRKEQEGIRRGPKTYLAKFAASALLHKKAKRAIGLSRARLVACGAAPISEETLKFMSGLDIPIREVWGMSETCGAGTANVPGATKLGSVGRPYPGIEIKIDPEGEICIKSPTNFSGYAKDPEATSQTLADGWLRTGDLGRIDKDGYVYITGRKKDIIITSGGKNIAPAMLEMELTALPLVENAIVCGDRRPYLSALLTLHQPAVAQFASEKGLSLTDPQLEEAIRQELQAGIDAINERHARVENIRRFAILPQPLSIENGDLTPTMKVKRAAVIKRCDGIIDALYDQAVAA
jgi:long-chain acyl-CoA synthetase